MSWINELDTDIFKEFILHRYEPWLEEWVSNLEYRIKKPERYDASDKLVKAWEARLVEVKAELEKVRGMY